jgi:deoxyribodipyrimidine photo-lyase
MLGPDYSSKFSAFLAIGNVSPVYIFKELLRYEAKFGANDSTDHFAKELIWREFFRYLSIKKGSSIFYVQGILDPRDIDREMEDKLDCWKIQALEFK